MNLRITFPTYVIFLLTDDIKCINQKHLKLLTEMKTHQNKSYKTSSG